MTSYADADRDPRTIERDIDRSRERVSETIDALQSKLSASGVIDEVAKAVSAHSGEITGGLGRAVRDNPLPLVLTGIGLAWLMASSGEKSGASSSYSSSPSPAMPVGRTAETDPGIGERLSDTVSSTLEGLRGSVESARDAAGHAFGAAGDMAGDMASGAAGTWNEGLEAGASHVRTAARWSGARGGAIRKGLGSLAEDQPLVLGALALAIGAAIGGILPRTHVEDELMGAEADRLKAAAKSTIKSEGAKVAAVADAVAKEAIQVVDEAGNKLAESADDLADHAREVSTRLHDAARHEDEAQRGKIIEGAPERSADPSLGAPIRSEDAPFGTPENGAPGNKPIGRPGMDDQIEDPFKPGRG